MSRKTATAIRPPIPAIRAWRSESSPSVAEMSVRSTCSNRTGRAPVCRTRARSFASCDRSQTGDLGRVPGDPVRVLLVVDRRPGPDLVVEDDREVLEERFGARELRRLRLAAHSERPRDVVELLATRARELHDHDRLVRLRVEVLTRAGQLQVVSRHLGDRLLGRRVVLEQVVVGPGARCALESGADLGRLRAARDDDAVPRHGEHLRALRKLPVLQIGDRLFFRRRRSRQQALVLPVDVPGGRQSAALHLVLDGLEQRVERVARDREALGGDATAR